MSAAGSSAPAGLSGKTGSAGSDSSGKADFRRPGGRERTRETDERTRETPLSAGSFVDSSGSLVECCRGICDIWPELSRNLRHHECLCRRICDSRASPVADSATTRAVVSQIPRQFAGRWDRLRAWRRPSTVRASPVITIRDSARGDGKGRCGLRPEVKVVS